MWKRCCDRKTRGPAEAEVIGARVDQGLSATVDCGGVSPEDRGRCGQPPSHTATSTTVYTGRYIARLFLGKGHRVRSITDTRTRSNRSETAFLAPLRH